MEISKEFLEQKLAKKISSFEVTPGIRPGDGHTTNIQSIAVQLETGSELFLVLKSFPPNGSNEFLKISSSFYKEVSVYEKLFPALDEMQIDFEIKISFSKPIFVSGSGFNFDNETLGDLNLNSLEINYLLMKDMRKCFAQEFKMADRKTSLDFSHCLLIMAELAKIHSLTWAYKKMHKIPSLKEHFDFLDENIYNPRIKYIFESMIEKNKDTFGQMTSEKFGSNSQIYKNLQEFYQKYDLWDEICSIVQAPIDEQYEESKMRIVPAINTEKEPWIVGTLMDTWTNNMLFKYDSQNQPEEIIMLDFQFFRESCPTLDLSYFFYMSTDCQFRQLYLDQLLQSYFQEFVKNCEILKVDPLPGFTIDNLRRRFRRAKLYAFLNINFFSIAALTDPKEGLELISDEKSDKCEDTTEDKRMNKIEKDLVSHRFCGFLEELFLDNII